MSSLHGPHNGALGCTSQKKIGEYLPSIRLAQGLTTAANSFQDRNSTRKFAKGKNLHFFSLQRQSYICQGNCQFDCMEVRSSVPLFLKLVSHDMMHLLIF